MCSRPEQGRGYHGDSVGAAVGGLPRGEDDRVFQVLAELLAQPVQVAHVALVGRLAELHLDGDDLVSALDDEVDLPVAAPRAQV